MTVNIYNYKSIPNILEINIYPVSNILLLLILALYLGFIRHTVLSLIKAPLLIKGPLPLLSIFSYVITWPGV